MAVKFYWHLKHQFINVSIYCDTFHLFGFEECLRHKKGFNLNPSLNMICGQKEIKFSNRCLQFSLFFCDVKGCRPFSYRSEKHFSAFPTTWELKTYA